MVLTLAHTKMTPGFLDVSLWVHCTIRNCVAFVFNCVTLLVCSAYFVTQQVSSARRRRACSIFKHHYVV